MNGNLSSLYTYGDSFYSDYVHDSEVENFTAADDVPCEKINTVPTWIPAVSLTISLTGLIFNAIAIFVIIVLKDFKKSVSHWYVLQLAIADSIFLAMLPLRILQDIRGIWTLPPVFCKMYQGFFMLNYYSGIFFLTVMSFDRYVAIVHPMSAAWRRFRTHGNAVLITIGVWILSLAVSLPLWIFSEVNCVCEYRFPSTSQELADHHGINSTEAEQIMAESLDFDKFENLDTEELQEIDDLLNSEGHVPPACLNKPYASFKAWVYGNFIVAFILPVLIMTICYSLILWRVLHPAVRSANRTAGRRKSTGEAPPRGKLRSLIGSLRSSSTSSSGSAGKEPKKLSQKQKVTTIVISLVIIFIICWLPYHINHLAKIRGLPFSSTTCSILNDVTSMIAFANSMLNPIFYTFLGSRFYRRLSTATWSFFRGRGKSTRFTGFSYSRASRARAPSSGRNGAGNGTRMSDASATHHTVHSTVTSLKIFHPSDLHSERHLATEDHDVSESQRAHESVVEMKQMVF